MIEQLLQQQNQLLGELIATLRELKPQAPLALNMQFPIEEFAHFDWAQIGARVVKHDEDGPTVVERDGHQYRRRSPQNKFTPAVWYSRCVGKDDQGNANAYEKLVSFVEIKDDQVDPISAKAKQAMNRASAAQASAASAATTETAAATKPAETATAELRQKQALVASVQKELERLKLKDGSQPVRKLIEEEWQCEWSANIWFEASTQQLKEMLVKLQGYVSNASNANEADKQDKAFKLDHTLFWETLFSAGMSRETGKEIVRRHTANGVTNWQTAQANLIFRITLNQLNLGTDVAQAVLKQAGNDFELATRLLKEQFQQQAAA